MPHAMTEDHSLEEAEGQYRAPVALTGEPVRAQPRQADTGTAKATADAAPAAPARVNARAKRTE